MKYLFFVLLILSLSLNIMAQSNLPAEDNLSKSDEFFLLQNNQKVAVIYIATGNYIVFWDNFYQSAEKNFLPGVKKHYFLVSNYSFEKLPDNVTHIYYPHKEWPSITVEKFNIIYSLKDKLTDYAYTYSFNANTWFIQPITDDIIPNETQKIIAGLHPSFYKTNHKYPYCSDKESPAYLEQNEKSQYYQASILGGITNDFLKMAQTIKEWTNSDLKRNYIPVWHDESYFNKYVADIVPLELTPNYLWGSFPSEKAFNLFANNVKIVMLKKNKSQDSGMNYYRNIKLIDENPKSLLNFFYISYRNGDADFVSFDNNLFYTITNKKSATFVKKEDLYQVNYSDGKELCFREIKGSSFLYEIDCPSK